MEAEFTRIYDTDLWGGSGPGSAADYVQLYYRYLSGLLHTNPGLLRIVDLGCGLWGRNSPCPDFHTGSRRYVGVDCVAPVILANQIQHESLRAHFVQGDISTMELPPGDLAIVKDVLQHWPEKEIHAFLPKLRRYRCVLVTNCTTHENTDISSPGEFRPLNLSLPPYNLPVTDVLHWRTKAVQLLRHHD